MNKELLRLAEERNTQHTPHFLLASSASSPPAASFGLSCLFNDDGLFRLGLKKGESISEYVMPDSYYNDDGSVTALSSSSSSHFSFLLLLPSLCRLPFSSHPVLIALLWRS